MPETTTVDVRWDLSDLYKDLNDPAIEADLARASGEVDAFASSYRERVATLAPVDLCSALEQLEQIYTLMYRPSSYAFLAFSTATADPAAQALLGKVREMTTTIGNQLLFFEIELKAMPAEQFEALVEAPELGAFAHYLRAQRVFASHTLSEPEERLVAQLQLTGAAAWTQLFTEVTSSLRFPVEIDGDVKQLTDSETRALRTRPDRDLRRRSNESLYTVYANNSQVLGYIFNTLFQDHKIALGIRHFDHAMEPTVLQNELSLDLVELLLSTTEANYPLAQEYYRLKAERIGLAGDFHYYDVMAPYQAEERTYTWNEGKDLVLTSFGTLAPEARATVKTFFDNNWIDGMPRAGKRGGAFCMGILPAYHPYVLTNFNSRLDDVFTVAHELGHGLHFMRSRTQSPLNYDPSTPMAEVASIFGELLLARHLQEVETDPEVRRAILAKMIEDAIATAFRQVMYTRWEQRAITRRTEGVVTADEYSAIWDEENRRLYGDTVRFEPHDRWAWISIPHFINYRFYCYSYAFGHLLAYALYQKFREDGPAFAPRYLELLASGGKDRPEKLLQSVGVDPLAPGFWQRGFDVLRAQLDEFKGL